MAAGQAGVGFMGGVGMPSADKPDIYNELKKALEFVKSASERAAH